MRERDRRTKNTSKFLKRPFVKEKKLRLSSVEGDSVRNDRDFHMSQSVPLSHLFCMRCRLNTVLNVSLSLPDSLPEKKQGLPKNEESMIETLFFVVVEKVI